MSVEAEPVYWPEREDETEQPPIRFTKPRITHFRHRVGDYDVTRLVFDSRDDVKAEGV